MIDYRAIFFQDPYAYLRDYYVHSFSRFIKSIEINEVVDPSRISIDVTFANKEKGNLIITDKMYKEIVDSYVVHGPHNRSINELKSQLVKEREARKAVMKEFEQIRHPRSLIKVLASLRELEFVPTERSKDSYSLICTLQDHKEFYFSPKTKEIWPSNTQAANYIVKRGAIVTLGDYYTRNHFDKHLDDLLNEIVTNTKLKPDYNYSNFLKCDTYRMTFDEIADYCKLFSHNIHLEIQYEDVY